MVLNMEEMKFMSKAELARQLGVSRETLRKKLQEVKGLHTGRRQLLYPYEVRMVYEAFGIQISS
ncbi:helix-turn-helix domain-containing protein [Fulvivirgaceae bacterium BMA12]|uniref:Helix-turn-helix domain-containing protein n=1 Tax=Agaribacillus aureus TaxID=3051825 RepID=A0ABT8LB92_9BACT|nr:helix-turn-helix domain-containing protein [Fulvivirgaceae bacterium BMA12]